MNHDGRALTEFAIEKIGKDIFAGLYNLHDIEKLFNTIRIQRYVLGQMFDFFKSEPLRRVSTADPVPNSQLAHFKELVSMDDRCSQIMED